MSEAATAAPDQAPALGLFERYLTLWVALCIIAGIGLGQAMPDLFQALGTEQWRRSTCRLPCWSG
ncbi:hypothetical protein GCM10011504_23800 [Siccirubricoccus deserti]|nr:hypothetical protein GCM10011504_23800 [Siccirubricoccus deserti]